MASQRRTNSPAQGMECLFYRRSIEEDQMAMTNPRDNVPIVPSQDIPSRTSALNALPLWRPSIEVEAAIAIDWRNGRPETVVPDKTLPLGSIQTPDGYSGWVALGDYLGRPYTDFRSIPKTRTPIWRLVFALNADGKPIFAGRIRKARKTIHGHRLHRALP
jgi:hypothetical protein